MNIPNHRIVCQSEAKEFLSVVLLARLDKNDQVLEYKTALYQEVTENLSLTQDFSIAKWASAMASYVERCVRNNLSTQLPLTVQFTARRYHQLTELGVIGLQEDHDECKQALDMWLHDLLHWARSNARCIIVVSLGYWGKGTSFAEAQKNRIDSGGRKSDKTIAFVCDEHAYVDNRGNVCAHSFLLPLGAI